MEVNWGEPNPLGLTDPYGNPTTSRSRSFLYYGRKWSWSRESEKWQRIPWLRDCVSGKLAPQPAAEVELAPFIKGAMGEKAAIAVWRGRLSTKETRQPLACGAAISIKAQSLSQRPCSLRSLRSRSLPTPSAAACNHFMPRGVEDAEASKKKNRVLTSYNNKIQ